MSYSASTNTFERSSSQHGADDRRNASGRQAHPPLAADGKLRARARMSCNNVQWDTPAVKPRKPQSHALATCTCALRHTCKFCIKRERSALNRTFSRKSTKRALNEQRLVGHPTTIGPQSPATSQNNRGQNCSVQGAAPGPMKPQMAEVSPTSCISRQGEIDDAKSQRICHHQALEPAACAFAAPLARTLAHRALCLTVPACFSARDAAPGTSDNNHLKRVGSSMACRRRAGLPHEECM